MKLLEGKRILVVEDDAANLAITLYTLQHAGAICHFERWGAGTVDAMKKLGKIDIVLLDLMFPRNVSGYDVFDRIRADITFNDVPIVAVTALNSRAEMTRARAKGFSGYIFKPIDPDTFPVYVASILSGTQIWGGSLEDMIDSLSRSL
jgi:two-component system, cell cycle response regulator DivK